MKLTLKTIIKEAGENYMDIIREGESPSEMANSLGYFKCDCCNAWSSEMAITSGMSGSNEICEDCLENHTSKKAVQEAVKDTISQNGDDYDVKKYLR